MNDRKPTPDANSVFSRLGSHIYRHRIWTLIIWAVFTLVSLLCAPLLENALQEVKVVDETGAANSAELMIQEAFDINPDALTVVFQQVTDAPSENASNDRSRPVPSNVQPENVQPKNVQTEIDATLASIRSLPEVASISTPLEHPEYISSDRQTQYSIINLKSLSADAIDKIEQTIDQANADTAQSPEPALNIYLTGKPAIDQAVQSISKADLRKVELAVLPITLIVLVLVFGSVVAAAMPIAMGVVTVSVTLGLLYLIAQRLSVSVFALNLTSMLGLGLGIDYALLIVNRFQKELTTHSVEQAIRITSDTAGRAIFFSGITVCISLFGLVLFPIRLLQSLGIAGAIVVSLSVLTALTLLPALLGLVGHGIHYGSLFSVVNKQQKFWRTIARAVIRRSVLFTILVLLIVAGLTAPFFSANFGVGNADILPASAPAREGVDQINQAFGPGETAPILVTVQSRIANEPLFTPARIATLYQFIDDLQQDPRVSSIQSIVNLDPTLTVQSYQQLYANPAQIPIPQVAAAFDQLTDRESTLVIVKSKTAQQSEATRNLVREFRNASLEGLEIRVAGQTASELDVIAAIERRLPLVLSLIMVATFITLSLLLRSLILPIKAIIMNLLSMGASFGALVFIFQDGNFQNLLNFKPIGYIDVLLPVVLFCVLFGLSMDYEVFLLTRIKETYDELKHNGEDPNKNNTASVIIGLEQTGQLITSAALLVIIVTSAFAFTSLIFVKALGLGIAIAIAIDTTLIRIILVPASMKLMGKWNWWTPTARHSAPHTQQP